MECRTAENRDLTQLVKLHSQFSDFPLCLDNTFSHLVIEDEQIQGFAWLQLMTEANIILNLDTQGRKKFEVLRTAIERCREVAFKAGFDQVHAFSKDPRFSAILKKHYNFRDVTGDALVLNLR